MKAVVDKSLCITCGLCMEEYPKIFKIGNDGKAEAINEELSDENEEAVLEAVDICPVDAISVNK